MQIATLSYSFKFIIKLVNKKRFPQRARLLIEKIWKAKWENATKMLVVIYYSNAFIAHFLKLAENCKFKCFPFEKLWSEIVCCYLNAEIHGKTQTQACGFSYLLTRSMMKRRKLCLTFQLFSPFEKIEKIIIFSIIFHLSSKPSNSRFYKNRLSVCFLMFPLDSYRRSSSGCFEWKFFSVRSWTHRMRYCDLASS